MVVCGSHPSAVCGNINLFTIYNRTRLKLLLKCCFCVDHILPSPIGMNKEFSVQSNSICHSQTHTYLFTISQLPFPLSVILKLISHNGGKGWRKKDQCQDKSSWDNCNAFTLHPDLVCRLWKANRDLLKRSNVWSFYGELCFL